MENTEQLIQWYEKWEDECVIFDKLEKKYHPAQQVSAIIFLVSKLKRKDQKYLFHGEHDVLYIGSFRDFEDFTEEDVKILISHGVDIDIDVDSFSIDASC